MQDRIAALISPAGTLAVRVTPKARGERLVIEEAVEGGGSGARLKVYVTAAPEDGKAHAAVVKLLAKALGLPRSALSIVRGETARDKLVRVTR